MQYTRALKYTFPIMSGEDVLFLQNRLLHLGITAAGPADGIFGSRTDVAVRTYQQQQSMKVDGIVGPLTWSKLFEETDRNTQLDKIQQILADLKAPHGFHDSVKWNLGPDGIVIDGHPPETSGGEPQTVRKAWKNYSDSIDKWSLQLGVPAELIVATMCTETSGNASAIRKEPGYVSDDKTPNKISPGLMQTLISTARAVLADDTINRDWLLIGDNSIRAGAAYMASQWKVSNFDPPKVACAYNAGGIYYNDAAANRWKMRQYPIGTAEHANRFIQWFNDCFLMFKKDGLKPQVSFYRLLNE